MDEAQLFSLIEESNRIAEALEITAEKSAARTDYYTAAGAYRQTAVNAAIALELKRLTATQSRVV